MNRLRRGRLICTADGIYICSPFYLEDYLGVVEGEVKIGIKSIRVRWEMGGWKGLWL